MQNTRSPNLLPLKCLGPGWESTRMRLGAGVDKLSTLVQLRLKTDVRVGSRWILLAIASYILWILYAISSHYGVSLPLLTIGQSLGLIGTLAFAASTGLSFLVYN